jgi:hypothetical protein
MLNGDPPVTIASGQHNDVLLNPMTLEPGEETIVLKRLMEVLRGQT